MWTLALTFWGVVLAALTVGAILEWRAARRVRRRAEKVVEQFEIYERLRLENEEQRSRERYRAPEVIELPAWLAAKQRGWRS